VLPYSPFSSSAKQLAYLLDAKLLLPEARSRYKPRESDVVINWGNTREARRATLNGCPDALQTACNKLVFFQQFEGRDWLPSFWTCPEEIPDEGFPVVARTVLTGHSGVGIVLCNTRDDLVPAPLYVKYVPKKDEYRVHLGKLPDGTVTAIAVQQKKRKLDCDQPNWKVRNHANGFVYAREGVDPPAGVLHASHDCMVRSGLDFAACDVIWNESRQQAYVLELNSAPGLEGQTLDDYVNYFTQVIHG
jgi:hypothetical protein